MSRNVFLMSSLMRPYILFHVADTFLAEDARRRETGKNSSIVRGTAVYTATLLSAEIASSRRMIKAERGRNRRGDIGFIAVDPITGLVTRCDTNRVLRIRRDTIRCIARALRLELADENVVKERERRRRKEKAEGER